MQGGLLSISSEMVNFDGQDQEDISVEGAEFFGGGK